MLTKENTFHLTTDEFLEKIATELWEKDNIYLISEEKRPDIPEYFYITAYLIEFETELMMQGLLGLLGNSTTYNFENTMDSLSLIDNQKGVACLQNILETLSKYGKTPQKIREEDTDEVILDKIWEDLAPFEEELYAVFPNIWEDLVRYLIKIRGK